jgi:hypothetical protein
MNGRIAPFLAALACGYHLEAAATGTTERSFIVRAGVMERAGAERDRLRETQEIPLDPTRRPGWCFIVDPPNPEPYEVYSVHHLPSAPKALTGDFATSAADEALSGIKTEVDRVDGIRPFCFDFHAGDPTGTYRIEVFINGVLSTTLQLHVHSPPAGSP